jgi:Bacterial Ig-like domain (group 1)/von Willebrand factor type A domain
MRANAGFLILLGLLLITGTVSALMADSPPSTIVTGKNWVVANGYDTSVITVTARNLSTGQYIPSASVAFTVNDANLGLISPASATTGATGVATSSFMTKTKSGTAVITATITSNDEQSGGGVYPHTTVITVNQKIDHDLPQNAVFDNPPEMLAGNISNLNITVTDVHGNLVDDKNTAEVHSFNLYMPGGDGRGLWDGMSYVGTKLLKTDYYGNASTQFRVSTRNAMNYLYMDPIGNMVTAPDTWINVISETGPCYVSQTYPSPNAIAANGVDTFEFWFIVYDKYLNPVNETEVRITASDGSTTTKKTNLEGMVWTSFGPKDLIGTYTITATPLANASILCSDTGQIGNCSQVVEFYNTDPVDLMVMANPQGMASLDVDAGSKGTVMAKVVDIKGNPVIGQTVSFSLGTPSYPGGPYNVTAAPYLSAPSATTGANGFATVNFIPGSFITDPAAPLYNATATGMVTATASWTNLSGGVITRDVVFVWKNYPYVGITVPSDVCKDAVVGNKINITVRINGDGAALKPKPIDAELVMDNSGSMSTAPQMNGPNGMQYKIYYTKKAGSTFIDKMNPATDMIGFTEFNASASTDISLGNNFVNVKDKLNRMTGNGKTDFRDGLYLGLKDLVDHGTNPRAVKAVIILTDGAFNNNGDPLARKTGTYIEYFPFVGNDGDFRWYYNPALSASEQTLVTYATEHNIRIYTVTLGVDPAIQKNYAANGSSWQIYDTMDLIAQYTGGKHYHATDGGSLIDIYTDIAGQLQTVAGGSTTVVINTGTVKINDMLSSDILSYMQYVADVHSPTAWPSDSTYLNKTNIAANGSMYFYSSYPRSEDDSVAWNAKMMSFTPGDIVLNDTWSTTFRVNLTQAGKVELFGPTNPSEICFTDLSTGIRTCQFIPVLQCNIQNSLVNFGFGDKHVYILNMTDPAETSPNKLMIRWNLTYDGEKTVSETVKYKNKNTPNAPWTLVPDGIRFEPKCFEKQNYMTIDTSTWPAGETYTILISGQADDAQNPAGQNKDWYKPGAPSQKFIKLE